MALEFAQKGRQQKNSRRVYICTRDSAAATHTERGGCSPFYCTSQKSPVYAFRFGLAGPVGSAVTRFLRLPPANEAADVWSRPKLSSFLTA